MYASSMLILGLGAFAAQALAGGIDTVVDTTVITVSSISARQLLLLGSVSSSLLQLVFN